MGKSTLLRSLSGVQDILAGEVFIKGESIKGTSAIQLAEMISIVLTGQPYSQNLSVLELIALGRQPYTNWIGTLAEKDKEHIRKSLELINIEDIQNKKCYELSDGQLQKVLIGRALAQDTPVILLDEPTTHLDIYNQAYVLKLLKRLTIETRKSIIFSTHEINLALQLCDKVILLQKDAIIAGSPSYLIEKEVFSEIFPADLIFFDRLSQTFKINDN